MPPNLSVPFELRRSGEQVISFEDGVLPVSGAEFRNCALQLFLPGKSFIVNEHVQLVVFGICLHIIRTDSEPSVEKTMVSFEEFSGIVNAWCFSPCGFHYL